MKVRVLIATVVGALALATTASAHPQPSAFNFQFGLSTWMDPDQQKLRDLMSVSAPAWSNAPQSAAKCQGGMAGEFPCDNVDMLSHMPLATIGGGVNGNDMWGWKDPQTGREYALMGRSNGTAFVDVTDPRRPVFVGNLPTQSELGGDSWRDIKVYENHAYVVSENRNHGMQVFDLTRLREYDGETLVFSADTVYDEVSNTHNLDINEESGFAYLVGTNTCGNGRENGGLHMVDISEPKNPTFAGCAIVPAPTVPGETNDNYVHDSQCVIYDGPDSDYTGREICFGSNEQAVVVYDVTNKANPVIVSETTYPTRRYTHQGWLTPDGKYFVFNDELDETGRTVQMQTTYIMNVEDLDELGEVMLSPNNTTSTDHNLYMSGDGYLRESNYTSGLRIFDEDSVPSGELDEVAWFDVYPENDNPGFEGGTWSNYQFDKGVVGVSTLDRGLFLLDPRLKKNGKGAQGPGRGPR